MRILLDTKDLINLLEKHQPISVSEFDKLLRERGDQLVLSYVNVSEIVAPLRIGKEFAEARPILIALEGLPVCYMRDSMILGDELREGKAAFERKQDPASINPYVRRWDESITPFGESPLRQLVNVSLSEIVLSLLKQNALPDFSREGDKLRSQFHIERSLSAEQRGTSRQAFVASVERHIRTHRIEIPKTEVGPFAEWLYENPQRCPATRITFEIYRSVLRNTTDIPKDNDILDINHLKALPYVDALTLDRRMDSYLRRVLGDLATVHKDFDFQGRIYKNVAAFLASS